MTGMITGSLLLQLLPRDLRGELCLAGIDPRSPGNVIRFRMDPGHAFERRGTVTGSGGGWYRIRIADRHRPGDLLAGAAGTCGMAAADVPDGLRAAAGRAWTRAAARPHWRDTLGSRNPATLRAWRGPAVTREMALRSAQLARGTGITLFLCWEAHQPRCVTVPPRDAVTFLSVTPDGAWSLHQDTCTYPLTGHPDRAALAAVRTGQTAGTRRIQAAGSVPPQVRLARGDLPGTGPPAVARVQRRPAWTGDQEQHSQTRRRGL